MAFREFVLSRGGGYLDLVACTMTQGLKLGILRNAKSFSITAEKGINRFSDVLPKGNQLNPISLIIANPVLDRRRMTLP